MKAIFRLAATSSCGLLLYAILALGACRQKPDRLPEAVGGLADPVMYALDVKTFQDSNGDGFGDFVGLTNRLGYLDSLGVNVIWLAPFQPGPGQDDGYDATDFFGIDKRLGNRAAFRMFLEKAHNRGIRVIMDIVLNHTSIEHPWFKEAQQSRTSRFRKWYVFSKERPDDADEGMVFPGVQKETWSFDSVSREYYFHRFYKFQPDLDYENPEVLEMAEKVIRYWLAQGLDGFRMDAVPFIIDVPRTGSAKPAHLFQILDRLAGTARAVKPDVLLLAEANVTEEENKDYFGEKGERMNLMFNFYANQYLFFALSQGNAGPYVKALEKFREKPNGTEWAHFLRNHDEIDLDRLTDWEQDQVYKHFGPGKNMQLYDRGIRRRLAPMLGNPARVAMAYSLLFSLPGVPVIRYGEEIGMGDDLSLKERLSVRTPMQWNSSRQGGFSAADSLVRPVIAQGPYGYRKLNVQQQLLLPNSLLNQVRTMIRSRKQVAGFFRQEWRAETLASGAVLMMRYLKGGQSLLTLHNFSDQPVEVRVPGSASLFKDSKQIFSLARAAIGTDGSVALPAFGSVWYISGKPQ
ncbi:trehalose synthase [Pedobacter yulinensis]|uniref:Trehalose synthase n=1 Tax=Pedobacter yulinensis TaxID=2126353 RepID=A0A2T3HK56_9SPHI|nr:alpha-amylase family glycosyl hydrolase [Pedobacter yulinensis]PST82793.1 trehalose synthase [Pedobacter yulinensis]